MLVIPAIDIIENKAVRLSKGDFNSAKQYSENPLEVVRQFYDAGFKRIHIVDLEASKTGSFTCLNLLEKIKSSLEIEVEFGGGIRKLDDLKQLDKIGIDYFIFGSITIKDEAVVKSMIDLYDKSRFIFAADVLEDKIKVSGWTESTKISLNEYIQKWSEQNIFNYLCTDINKDGMLKGPNTNLYKKTISKFPNINLIASGGISRIEDIHNLQEHQIKYAVVGKAFYEGRISIEELSKFA
ncbi:MAG: 1-(5-phosphoribosyl)-5-[(5-phosphoribosylamino)methylideneamino]imidazole-4-carboxamide isomerase [Ignavibacteriales bacterium]|nr:MAG: 1-(5-phosphoribosyl)-5-[(5-phosphoribosylamino)methylideneamino]imidazole-4-carboxamide isomerase [Ignavibacteriales bacterium]